MQNNAYIGSRFVSYAVVLDTPLSLFYQKTAYYNKVTEADLSGMAKTLVGSGLVSAVLEPEKK
jgi:hypothetical protein